MKKSIKICFSLFLAFCFLFTSTAFAQNGNTGIEVTVGDLTASDTDDDAVVDDVYDDDDDDDDARENDDDDDATEDDDDDAIDDDDDDAIDDDDDDDGVSDDDEDDDDAIGNGKKGNAYAYGHVKQITKRLRAMQIFVNGEEVNFDSQPVLENGRTLVPIRVIAEALGATVAYENGQVTITKDDVTITFFLGNKNAFKNGKKFGLEVAAGVRNGRTFVPLRFLSEGIGAYVNYDSATQTITVD